MERKLAAILAADVVGYSRLMEADEAGTLAALKSHRNELIDPEIAKHRGRIVKLMGDGALVEFASVVDAVACAVAIQEGMTARSEDLPEDRRITFRIGVHLGDVIVEGDDLYGDGINVAARLEGLAEPGGICISQQAYDQVETKVDLPFEDLGEQQVKNIARPVRVYRVRHGGEEPQEETATRRGLSTGRLLGSAAVVVLIVAGAVAAWWQPWKPDLEPTSVPGVASPPAGKPSIAVLPFDNMSGDAEQEYFADGMTEDLITDLARVSGLLVIARNSTFAYKGQSPDVREVAKQLDVRYVVEGSVRKAGGRIRINAQLIDAETGHHLWADRYDREAKDVFELQDEVRAKIVTALRVELTPAEEDRLARQLTNNPEAYDYYIRGQQQESFFTKEGNLESLRLFERAIELDPTFAAAMGRLATAHTLAARNGWSPTPEKSMETARLLAEKAVSLDADLPQAHWAMARIYSRRHFFDGARAIASLQKAIALDRNYADAYAFLASVLSHVGRADEALVQIERAMRLNPRFPFWYYEVLGTSHFMMGRYEAAIENYLEAIDRNPTYPPSHRYLVATYGHLGQTDDAEWEIEELAALGFELTLDGVRESSNIDHPASLQRYLDGLRKAGVQETLQRQTPDKPSIAVLPFDNMSTDPEQEYFADGMTEDLITDLAKVSGLLVIARNSTFAYKGQSPDVREVARQLGVRYVVEGSVRKAGGRIRINAQLIDAETGTHLWAERYDREATNVFELQDEVRAQIVAALQVKLTPAEVDRLANQLTNNIEAYDFYIRGLRQESFFSKEGNVESRRLFEKALELDPTFAAAMGRLATAHTLAAERGWSASPEESMETARLLAEKAVALNDDLPQAHWAMARVYSREWLFDGERAVASLRKAIDLDPNYADGYAFLATILILVGHGEEALGHIETAMRLNPRFPFWYYYALGASQFMLTRYDAAVESLEKAIERNSAWPPAHRILVAAYGHLEMIDEAEWEMEELRALGFEPTIANWISRLTIQDPAYLERYIDGLRKAGVPE